MGSKVSLQSLPAILRHHFGDPCARGIGQVRLELVDDGLHRFARHSLEQSSPRRSRVSCRAARPRRSTYMIARFSCASGCPICANSRYSSNALAKILLGERLVGLVQIGPGDGRDEREAGSQKSVMQAWFSFLCPLRPVHGRIVQGTSRPSSI